MSEKQRRHNARAISVEAYMDAHAEEYPPESKGGKFAARLKELLTQYTALDVARITHAHKRRQGTEGRDSARITLRRMIKRVWDTSKAIARTRPDTKGLFVSPSKLKNDRALVAAARAAADTAATLATLFAEYGLTATFFDDLRAQAASFDSHTSLQHSGVNARVDANAALEETLRQIDLVIADINTLINNTLAADKPKLAAWRSAHHLERHRSKPKDQGDDAPATESPAPPPTAANN